ncbi:MAG: hypothetical protein LQ343_005862 [Gyalolechia ehrenbergii]|nr:MAG: hypothetical protein LQ343_005862 [Gyalolechia ehrenbergii]
MESPVPYGADHLDSNPLLADGSDFPCKQRDNVYKLIKQNVMPIGQNQTLSFIGQATHGGGSCQISLTTDKKPTKDSVWKVIHSVEGGCPSPHPGNLGDDPFGHGTDKFQFAIPQQVPTGDYTLAWTWFNKIGNREMYMNCAPVTVTDSSQKHKRRVHRHGAAILEKRQPESLIQERADALSSLPNMFIANIGNGCNTAPSGTTLAIPQQNLGTSVDHHAPDELVPPIGNCGGGQAAPAGAARPQQSASLAPPAPSVQPQIPASPPAQAPAASASPSVQPQAPDSPPVSAPAPPAQAPAPPAPAPSGMNTGTCTTPGKSVCAPDGMGIGTCDERGQVIFAPAPISTKCDKTLGVLVHSKRQVFKA